MYKHYSFLSGTCQKYKMEANFSTLLAGVSIEPAYLRRKIYLSTSFMVRDMSVGNRNNKYIIITAEHGNSALDFSEVSV